jgi:hypothetical protein
MMVGEAMAEWAVEETWEEGHLPDLGSTYIAYVYPNRKERCAWRHYRY